MGRGESRQRRGEEAEWGREGRGENGQRGERAEEGREGRGGERDQRGEGAEEGRAGREQVSGAWLEVSSWVVRTVLSSQCQTPMGVFFLLLK